MFKAKVLGMWAITIFAGSAGLMAAESWEEDLRKLQQRLDQLEHHCSELREENQWLRAGQIAILKGDKLDQAGQAFFLSSQFGKDTLTDEPADEIQQASLVQSDKQPEPVPGVEIGKDTTLKVQWKNGLQLQSADQAFKLHVGGRLHMDAGWWTAEDQVEDGPGGLGPLQDGANYRRARIRVNGTIYRNINWIMEYGFENGVPAFFDTFGEMTELPVVGNLRIGHFREPFSMDSLTSGNSLMMMERSLFHDAMVPFRNTGIMAYDTWGDEVGTWALGGFRVNSNLQGADAGDGDYALTGRLTWNPWYEMKGMYALHFGMGFSFRNPPKLSAAGVPTASGIQRVRLNTRPEFRVNAPFVVDTGLVACDSQNLVGAEFGFGSGPVLIQAEYMATFLQNAVVGASTPDTALMQGCYIQGSYFLTGENRPYNRQTAVFGGVQPHERFFRVRRSDCDPRIASGSGAWEAAVRYSWIDLSDGVVRGGLATDVTFGLNWYLNPSSRFMWDYIAIHRSSPTAGSTGWAGALGMRYQIDF